MMTHETMDSTEANIETRRLRGVELNSAAPQRPMGETADRDKIHADMKTPGAMAGHFSVKGSPVSAQMTQATRRCTFSSITSWGT
jgi:hypothetical protein